MLKIINFVLNTFRSLKHTVYRGFLSLNSNESFRNDLTQTGVYYSSIVVTPLLLLREGDRGATYSRLMFLNTEPVGTSCHLFALLLRLAV